MDLNERDEQLEEQHRLAAVLNDIRRQLLDVEDKLGGHSDELKEIGRHMFDEVPSSLQDFESLAEIALQIELFRGQARDVETFRDLYRRLLRMSSSPYFGRMDFRETGRKAPEPFYIGIASLMDVSSGDPLVYDWRAPISSMYYDYPLGKAEYTAPDGIIEGELTLKRQYKIQNGELEYMFDSSIHIADEVLQAELGKHASEQMRSIVSSIQADQNRIIRDDKHEFVLVQGPAGSGKTSVAMQRIAYLLYKHRNRVLSKNIVLLTPNDLFSSYIANVLPELGEENSVRFTFDAYAKSVLSGIGELEGAALQLERLLSLEDREVPEAQSARFKSSYTYVQLLDRYIEKLETSGLVFEDVKVDKRMVFPRHEIMRLFYEKHAHLPAPKRMEKIRERLLETIDRMEPKLARQVEQKLMARTTYEGTEKEIAERSKNVIKKKLQPLRKGIRELPKLNLKDIYRNLHEDDALFAEISEGLDLPASIDAIRRYTVDALADDRIPYEDAAPLIYLKAKLQGIRTFTAMRQLVIDEAQDYGLFHFHLFRQLFPNCRMTVLADTNQSIHPCSGFADYSEVAKVLTAGKNRSDSALVLTLSKSYRSTLEINQFAMALLESSSGIDPFDRHGPLPVVVELGEKAGAADVDGAADAAAGARTGAGEGGTAKVELVRRIVTDVDRLRADGVESIGIICKTLGDCAELAALWQGAKLPATVTSNAYKLPSGPVILPSYLAKGLEFDAVLVYDASEKRYHQPSDRLLLYTICTRALHQLTLYAQSPVAPWVKDVPPNLYVQA